MCLAKVWREISGIAVCAVESLLNEEATNVEAPESPRESEILCAFILMNYVWRLISLSFLIEKKRLGE